jgi:hypothetical protein
MSPVSHNGSQLGCARDSGDEVTQIVHVDRDAVPREPEKIAFEVEREQAAGAAADDEGIRGCRRWMDERDSRTSAVDIMERLAAAV